MPNDNTMTADQFVRAVKKLGFPTVYASLDELGLTKAVAYRYANGDVAVPTTVVRLLKAYLKHGLPSEWK